jgi:hypothetical protein
MSFHGDHGAEEARFHAGVQARSWSGAVLVGQVTRDFDLTETAACSLGKCPQRVVACRNRAFSDSIAVGV